MDTQRRIPEIQIRVLIIGRANVGRTTLLQRVCDTTESPFMIYRGNEVVRLEPLMNRGEPNIDDELVFSNKMGYVFYDSRGFECGSTEELEVLKEFIRRKCGERRVQDRLHAIWYCVPMDGSRREMDLKFFKDICSDPNVPVIVVFTKYDQFIRDVKFDVLDYPEKYLNRSVSEVAEQQFQEHYLRPLGDDVRYVRLAKMHMPDSRCDELREKTAAALNDDIVTSMLSQLVLTLTSRPSSG